MSTKNLELPKKKVQPSPSNIPQGQQQKLFPKFCIGVNLLIRYPGINEIN